MGDLGALRRVRALNAVAAVLFLGGALASAVQGIYIRVKKKSLD